MPTIKAYLAEPQQLIGQAVVTALFESEKPIVRLDKTYFHPQGGGQKGDKGQIGTVVILDTKHAEGGAVDHFVASLDGLVVGEAYPITVDASSRHVNAVNHSAGHLIAAVVHQAFSDIKAVQGHHWPGEARVEFEGTMDENLVTRITSFLPKALSEAIADRTPVPVMGDPFVNRSVDFCGEQVPCGGTHVAHLGQIERIDIKSVKIKGNRLRISYDAFVNEAAYTNCLMKPPVGVVS